MVFHRNDSIIQKHLDLYGAADARYGNFNGYMESGTSAMETITALVVGPLCLLVAFAAIHDLSWRYPLQLVVCTMQLYGMLWLVLQPVFSAEGWDKHYASDEVRFLLRFICVYNSFNSAWRSLGTFLGCSCWKQSSVGGGSPSDLVGSLVRDRP